MISKDHFSSDWNSDFQLHLKIRGLLVGTNGKHWNSDGWDVLGLLGSEITCRHLFVIVLSFMVSVVITSGSTCGQYLVHPARRLISLQLPWYPVGQGWKGQFVGLVGNRCSSRRIHVEICGGQLLQPCLMLISNNHQPFFPGSLHVTACTIWVHPYTSRWQVEWELNNDDQPLTVMQTCTHTHTHAHTRNKR